MGTSYIVSIIYFSLYALLLIALSIYVHRTEPNLNKKKLLKSVWSKKAIYGVILVHLYDIATDLGVLIEWYNLAVIAKNDEKPYKTINISIFWFFLSFFFLWYRVTTACFAGKGAWEDGKRASVIWYILLGILDVYIIKEVIESIKRDESEPGPRQRSIQFAECLIESLPQVVLQTTFIILSYNDGRLRTDSSIALVIFSLIASILSVANKYLWFDRSGAHPKAYDLKFQKKIHGYCLSESSADDIVTEHPACVVHKTVPELCDISDKVPPSDSKWCHMCAVGPKDSFYRCTTKDCNYMICRNCYEQYIYTYDRNECINLFYALRVLWRFSFLCIRFIVLSLICVVIGAAFLFVFLLCSSVIWCCVYWFTVTRYLKEVEEEYKPEEACANCCLLSCLACVGNAPSSKYVVAIYHWMEMCLCMVLITVFALNETIVCVICADPHYRQMDNNPYVESFVILGWVMLFMDVVLYLIILRNAVLITHAELGAASLLTYAFSSLRDS